MRIGPMADATGCHLRVAIISPVALFIYTAARVHIFAQ